MTGPGSRLDASDVLGRLGRHWGWIFAYGVITVVAGIAVLAWPGPTLLVIAILVGIQLVVLGIFRFVAAFGPDLTAGARILYALLGVLSLIIGLYALRHVLITLLALGLLLGIFWVANGAVELFTALSHREVHHRGWMSILGLLSIVAGLVLLVYPGPVPRGAGGDRRGLAAGLRPHGDQRGHAAAHGRSRARPRDGHGARHLRTPELPGRFRACLGRADYLRSPRWGIFRRAVLAASCLTCSDGRSSATREGTRMAPRREVRQDSRARLRSLIAGAAAALVATGLISLGAAQAAPGAAAATAPRVDLGVLVVTDGNPWVEAIRQQLSSEGVPGHGRGPQ